MALINCPECKKEVSDKAANCPSCGFPLHPQETQVQTTTTQELTCPEFPADLSIGGDQIMNWVDGTSFSGEFRPEDNVVRTITPGGVKVILHKFGIDITNSFFMSKMELHNSQIISTEFADTSKLISQDKSVIGRAVVGGLLMGPMAAIIGGMSGIGSKNRIESSGYLVINYWDRFTKRAQTILIRGENIEDIKALVGRLNTERSKTQTDTQKKEIASLSATDQKILELWGQKDGIEAIKFYLQENSAELKNNPDGLNIARKYVEGLAKAYGVKMKSSGGCFIATACYGDYDAPEVLVLRQFRDSRLLTNPFGKLFVATYYTTSPFFATIISKSDRLKTLVRQYFLRPLITRLQRQNKNASR